MRVATLISPAQDRLRFPSRLLDRVYETSGLRVVFDCDRVGIAAALLVQDLRALDQLDLQQLLELSADLRVSAAKEDRAG
jgi:hypothetical protein